MTNREGRPDKWKSIEELQPLLEAYKDKMDNQEGNFADDNYEIPDVESLCVHLQCSRTTLCKFEGKEEFMDAIKDIKDWIGYKKKQLAMKWKIPAAIFCFDFKNNHWYRDKTEIEQTNIDWSIKEEDLDD